MLNLDLIDALYAGLTKEQQQELISLLFKRSKQTMSYFRRTKDISLSKLETLADFFHMPLDYFRVGSTFCANDVAGNGKHMRNVSVNTNLLMENKSLQKQLDALQDVVKAKDDVVAAKDALILALKEQLNPSVK